MSKIARFLAASGIAAASDADAPAWPVSAGRAPASAGRGATAHIAAEFTAQTVITAVQGNGIGWD